MKQQLVRRFLAYCPKSLKSVILLGGFGISCLPAPTNLNEAGCVYGENPPARPRVSPVLEKLPEEGMINSQEATIVGEKFLLKVRYTKDVDEATIIKDPCLVFVGTQRENAYHMLVMKATIIKNREVTLEGDLEALKTALNHAEDINLGMLKTFRFALKKEVSQLCDLPQGGIFDSSQVRVDDGLIILPFWFAQAPGVNERDQYKIFSVDLATNQACQIDATLHRKVITELQGKTVFAITWEALRAAINQHAGENFGVNSNTDQEKIHAVQQLFLCTNRKGQTLRNLRVTISAEQVKCNARNGTVTIEVDFSNLGDGNIPNTSQISFTSNYILWANRPNEVAKLVLAQLKSTEKDEDQVKKAQLGLSLKELSQYLGGDAITAESIQSITFSLQPPA